MASQFNDMEFWLETGCVRQEYLDRVLGPQNIMIVPGLLPPRFLTEEDLQGMDCPYPPEEGYE
jgi:hypothetical protein